MKSLITTVLGRESLMHKFEGFLARSSQSALSLSSAEPGPSKESTARKKRVILLEDLPNILHQETQSAFHSAIKTFLDSPFGVPLVIIISEVFVKGMARDERLGVNGDLSSNKEEISIRTALPSSLINGPFVRQIACVPTLLL